MSFMRILPIFIQWLSILLLTWATHGSAYFTTKGTWKLLRSNDPSLQNLMTRRPLVIEFDSNRFKFVDLPLLRGNFKLLNQTRVETALWGVVHKRFRILPTSAALGRLHLLSEGKPSTFYILQRLDGREDQLRSSWEQYSDIFEQHLLCG